MKNSSAYTGLLLFFIAVIGFALFVGHVNGQTAPKYVAKATGVGFIPVYATTASDSTRITVLQFAAQTNMRFSFWGMKSDSTWFKIAPGFGATPSDSTIPLLAGASEVYNFTNLGNLRGIYVSQGTGEIKGE